MGFSIHISIRFCCGLCNMLNLELVQMLPSFKSSFALFFRILRMETVFIFKKKSWVFLCMEFTPSLKSDLSFFSVNKLFIGDASVDYTCKDGNVRLTVVPLKPFFDHKCGKYCRFSMFNSDQFLMCFLE